MRIDEYLRIYGTKHDEELLLLAGSSAELTDEARTALGSELARRGLRAEPTPIPNVAFVEKASERQPEQILYSASTGRFLGSVMRVYRQHFWLFISLMAPAIIFSHYIRRFMYGQAGKVMQDVLTHPDTQHGNQTIELWLLNIASYFVIWLFFCVSYAAICLAVNGIQSGAVPPGMRLVGELRARIIRIFSVGTLLFVLTLIGIGLVNLIQLVLIRFLGSRILGITGWAIALLLGSLVSLLVSRFALSVPAVVLGHRAVGAAMFLSDELTEGKWSILASLLVKSVVGGYIASNLPFWIDHWINLGIPTGYLTAASIAGVIVVEPIMLIGFCLIYLNSLRATVSDGENTVSAQFA